MVYGFSTPPPGSAVIEIESRECSSACNARQWDVNMPKPQQAAAWSSSQWMNFSQEMDARVRQFRKDGQAIYALLLIPVGILLLIISLPSASPRGAGEGGDTPDKPGFTIWNIIHVPFIFLAVIITLTISSSRRVANQAIDREIEALCRRSSDGLVTLQYYTEFTAQCKPKGARTYRALYIITAGGTPTQMEMGMQHAMQQPGTLQVTCPPTSKAGDTILIQAPSGPMQVTVPDGVMPGGIFMVQTPPVPAVAVVQAVAVPA